MSASTRKIDDPVGGYRQRVTVSWFDLNKRDRLGLEAELDRTLAEIPIEIDPLHALGDPQALAAEMRLAAGLPARMPWVRRLWSSPWWTKASVVLAIAAGVAVIWYARTALAMSCRLLAPSAKAML